MTSSTHDRSLPMAHDAAAATRARTEGRVPCRPSDVRSIALAPLTETDKRALRGIGREVRTFDRLAVEIMRTQAILAIMPPRDDPEALRGLRRRERRLLLEALSLGTAEPDEMRLAAALTRCTADDGDNVLAMLAAALENDCMRLGLASERERPEIDDG